MVRLFLRIFGAGVLECRINLGTGYRLYLGRDGKKLVIVV